jgi:thymidylate synthase ThyX
MYARLNDELYKWLIGRSVDKGSARKQARGAARGYLGNALSTELIFSASVAQWKRMLRMRCSAHADGEIRAVFVEVLSELKKSRYASDFETFSLEPSPDGIGQCMAEKA